MVMVNRDLVQCIQCLCIASFIIGGVSQKYNYDYLQDNCTVEKVIDLHHSNLSLYGFIRATRNAAYAPGSCSIAVKAAPDRNLIVRFRRIEIYKPSSNCDENVLEISGNTSSLKFCGTGTPGYPILSTGNYLRFNLRTKEYEFENTMMGFELYYTAFHKGVCDTEGGTEFQCRQEYRCIPDELRCDNLDNCGDWSDEGIAACGLSTGAIVAISVVCTLVGGSVIGFCIHYGLNKRKERNRRRQRGNEINPTMSVSHHVVNHRTTINVTSEQTSVHVNGTGGDASEGRRYTEPPPPYTYTNAGLYSDDNDNVERDPDAPPAYDTPTSSESTNQNTDEAVVTSTVGDAQSTTSSRSNEIIERC